MPAYRSAPRVNLTVVLSLAIAAVSVIALSLVLLERRPGGDAPAVLTVAAESGASVSAAVAAELAKLDLKPAKGEGILDKALRVRQAIKQGDEATAARLSSDVLAASQLRNWDFYPFTDFIEAVPDVVDPIFAQHLDDWVAHSPAAAMPLLIRAQYERDHGWYRRGDLTSNRVSPAAMQAFSRDLDRGMADVDAAIHLDPANPLAYYLRLRILRGYGLSGATADAFKAGIDRFPGYYPLYTAVLQTLQPRWGGNLQLMRGFVDKYAGQAPDQSPMKLLYLQLYGSYLSSAAFDCWRAPSRPDCVADYMRKIVDPALDGQLKLALQLYDQTGNDQTGNDQTGKYEFGKYEFGLAIEPVMTDMLTESSGDFYSGALLQLIATAMHSDTQLKQEVPGRNDYMLDKLLAQSWYQKGFYDNALSKYMNALADIKGATFPSDEARDLAIAGIYHGLSDIYNQTDRSVEMMAAAQASIALGGRKDEEHFICWGYDRLKAESEAVAACSRALEIDPANLRARFLRADIYTGLGKTDDALQDYTMVAESEASTRANAVISMSMIYFNRKDLHGALDLLNRYPYLYNPDLTGKTEVAVGYNNRCYAYMELGELQKALDDCQQSLKYGSIPDAYRKEQELVKRLAPPDGAAPGAGTPDGTPTGTAADGKTL